jgi:S-adenosylmethionine:tRNA-ribosyltransferase-isomerase (queuine synthetase)
MLYDGQAFETNRCDYHDGAEWTPLYTHPPRREWQSLTEEEIATINKEGARGSAIRRDGTTAYRIARAVEQALKERNNG